MQAQRAIVLLLLESRDRVWWSRAEVERRLNDIPPLELSDALACLEAEDVVIIDAERVRASRCARHIDLLEMFAI